MYFQYVQWKGLVSFFSPRILAAGHKFLFMALPLKIMFTKKTCQIFETYRLGTIIFVGIVRSLLFFFFVFFFDNLVLHLKLIGTTMSCIWLLLLPLFCSPWLSAWHGVNFPVMFFLNAALLFLHSFEILRRLLFQILSELLEILQRIFL